MEDVFCRSSDKLIVRIPRSKLNGLDNLWNKKSKVKRERRRQKEKKTKRVVESLEDVLSSRPEDKSATKSGERTMNEEERHVEEITHFKKRIIRNHSVTSEANSTSPNTIEDDASYGAYKTSSGSTGQFSCEQNIQQQRPHQARSQEKIPNSKQNISLRYTEQNSKEPINYSSTRKESSIASIMKEKDGKNQVGKHQLPTVVMPTNTRTTVRPTISSRRLSLAEPLLNRTSPTGSDQSQAPNTPLSAPIIEHREHVRHAESVAHLEQRPETSLVVDIQLPKMTPIQRNSIRGPTVQNFPNQFSGYPYQRPRYPLPVAAQPNLMDYYRGNMNNIERRSISSSMEQLLHQQLTESRGNLRQYSSFTQRAPPAYTEVSHRHEQLQQPQQLQQQQQYSQNHFMTNQVNFDRRRIPQTVVSPQASMLPPNISPSIPHNQDRHEHEAPDEKTDETELNIYEAMERECAKVLNNYYQVMDTIRDSERSRKNNSSSRAYFFLAMNKISSKIGEIESFMSKCNEFAEKSKSNHDEHHIFYSLLDCMKDFTARIRAMVSKARSNPDRKKNYPLITAVEESFYKNVFYRMFDYITSNSSLKNEDKDNNKPQEVSPTSDDNFINCIIVKQQELLKANGRNMIVMPLVGQCPNRCCSTCPNHVSLESEQPNGIQPDEEKTESQRLQVSKAREDQPEKPKPPSEKPKPPSEKPKPPSEKPKLPGEKPNHLSEKPKLSIEKPKGVEDPVLDKIEKELEMMEQGNSTADSKENSVDNKAETLKQIQEIEAKQKPKYKISEILCIEIDSDCDSSDDKLEVKQEPEEEGKKADEEGKKVEEEGKAEKKVKEVEEKEKKAEEKGSILKRKLEEWEDFELAKKVKLEVGGEKVAKKIDDDIIVIDDNENSDDSVVITEETIEEKLEEKNEENIRKTPQTFKKHFPNTVISKNDEIPTDKEEILIVDKGNGRHNHQRRNSFFYERMSSLSPSTIHSSDTSGTARELKKSFSSPPDVIYPNVSTTITNTASNNHLPTPGVLNLSNPEKHLAKKLLNVPEIRIQENEERVTSPRIPIFPKLGSIYDESVKTDGFVSQIIKEQIICLSRKEALEPLEYVKEVETLQKIRTLPDEFKEFYIYITKVQILHKHNPIAFRLFLELLNQGGLIDYHKKFSEYVTRKRIINKSLSNLLKEKSRRSSIKNK